jgi:hypothetical protein
VGALLADDDVVVRDDSVVDVDVDEVDEDEDVVVDEEVVLKVVEREDGTLVEVVVEVLPET